MMEVLISVGEGDLSEDSKRVLRKRQFLPGEYRPRHTLGVPTSLRRLPFISLSEEQNIRRTHINEADMGLYTAFFEDLAATQRAAVAAVSDGNIGQYLLLHHAAQQNANEFLDADPRRLSGLRKKYLPKSIEGLRAMETAEMRLTENLRGMERDSRRVAEKIMKAKIAAARALTISGTPEKPRQIFQGKK